MFKGNMSKLLKQAQDVQQQIEKVQSQLSDMIIESESGGGMVKVKVTGKQEVLELCIDESTLQEDKEISLDKLSLLQLESVSLYLLSMLLITPSKGKILSTRLPLLFLQLKSTGMSLVQFIRISLTS